jgi:uncharacterized protein (DUF302 family)
VAGISLILESIEETMTLEPSNGIVSIRSHQTVDQTVKKLEDALRAKGVKLFALIDHSGEAQKVGLEMRPTKLLIFGSLQQRHSISHDLLQNIAVVEQLVASAAK